MFLAARWRLTIVFTIVLVIILAASGGRRISHHSLSDLR